jgi:prepilin-type N-terminal cleavage/methylation domain-containing protein/prepilin-type processing-associated H-X9-DG protein
MLKEERSRRGRHLETRAAFTLIELLVVIAIVATLAAILFPVLVQARGKAGQCACLSHSRQIGIAATMYMQDYDGVLPLTRHASPLAGWLESVQPYVKSRGVFRCPGDASSIGWAQTQAEYEAVPIEKRLSSYYINAWLAGSQGYGHDAAVQIPASVIYVAESPDDSRSDHFHPMCWGETDPEMPGCARSPFAWNAATGETREIALRRHNDGSNYIYVDGHAMWRTWRQVWWQDRARGVYEGDFDPRQ